MANAFYTSYNYKRELESHLMKNTEWGAVAYLSHSNYGYANNITANLNTNFLTGYANSSDCWNTIEGKKASTNQNITGVYDMSGGAWEIVAGVLMTENKEYISGQNSTNNSGFIGIFSGAKTGEKQSLTKEDGGLLWKEKRYYDFYEYNTVNSNYSKRILGDATGEMGPFNAYQSSWYTSHSYFLFYGLPWFMRGGGVNSGLYTNTISLFAFSDMPGGIFDSVASSSFRIILTP